MPKKVEPNNIVLTEQLVVPYCPDRKCYLGYLDPVAYECDGTVDYYTTSDPYVAEGIDYVTYTQGDATHRETLDLYLKQLRKLTHHKCVLVLLTYYVDQKEI